MCDNHLLWAGTFCQLLWQGGSLEEIQTIKRRHNPYFGGFLPEGTLLEKKIWGVIWYSRCASIDRSSTSLFERSEHVTLQGKNIVSTFKFVIFTGDSFCVMTNCTWATTCSSTTTSREEWRGSTMGRVRGATRRTAAWWRAWSPATPSRALTTPPGCGDRVASTPGGTSWLRLSVMLVLSRLSVMRFFRDCQWC